MSQRAAAIHRIFTLAAERQGHEREQLLQRECAEDPSLRSEVEALLHHDEPSRFLAEPQLAVVRQRLDDRGAVLPERIGAFRPLEELGRGGMGVVYRAAQDQPAREVALKVLAPGLGGAEAHARFALEAEALGRLQHPGIAQIHEAGRFPSPQGEQPYLAMELVRGVPLHTWAATTRPTLAARLELLVQIAEAVHHAHQKGVIHRDLKPGNVLVDADGRAKVLDFGIARCLDADRARTLQTHTGQLLGTLAYMSPEQANGEFDRVDVRSDVYSLGAIDYELLAGQPPLDVRSDALTQSLRRIVEEEPTPLGAHDKRLRGDLQTIVAKALRKEPERRYASALALADDLRRFLLHEPILARPATAAYVLRCFTRRHRGIVAGAALAVVALVVGTALSLSWALRAEAAERQAREEVRVSERVTAMLQNVLLGADPEHSSTGAFSAQDFLRRGRDALAKVGDDMPMATVRVSETLGSVLASLGDFRAADEYLGRALDTLRRHVTGDDPRLVEALHVRAWALQRQQRIPEAAPLFAEALAMHRRLGPQLPLTTAKCLEGLGLAASIAGDHEQALRLYTEALPWREKAGDPLFLAYHWMQVGKANVRVKSYPAAAAAYARAEAVLQGSGDRWPAAMAQLSNELGDLCIAQGRLADAIPQFERAIANLELCYGADSKRLLMPISNLSAMYAQTGRLPDAETVLLRGERLLGDLSQVQDPNHGDVLHNLGHLRVAQKRHADAIGPFQRALQLDERLRPGSARHRMLLKNLSALHHMLGDETAATAMRDRLQALGPAPK